MWLLEPNPLLDQIPKYYHRDFTTIGACISLERQLLKGLTHYGECLTYHGDSGKFYLCSRRPDLVVWPYALPREVCESIVNQIDPKPVIYVAPAMPKPPKPAERARPILSISRPRKVSVADLRIEDLKKRNVVKSNALNRLEHDLPAVIARVRQGEVGQTEALLRYVFYTAKFGSKRNPPDLQAVLFLTALELRLSPEKRQRFLHLRSLPKRAEILTPRCPRGRPRTEDQEEQEIVAALLREKAMGNQQVSRPRHRLRGALACYERADKEVSEELHEADRKVSEELDEDPHEALSLRSIRGYYGKHRDLIVKLREMGIDLAVEVEADGKRSLTIKNFRSLAWFKKLPGKIRRL